MHILFTKLNPDSMALVISERNSSFFSRILKLLQQTNSIPKILFNPRLWELNDSENFVKSGYLIIWKSRKKLSNECYWNNLMRKHNPSNIHEFTCSLMTLELHHKSTVRVKYVQGLLCKASFVSVQLHSSDVQTVVGDRSCENLFNALNQWEKKHCTRIIYWTIIDD